MQGESKLKFQHNLLNDSKLLPIFLSKIGIIWIDYIKEFRNNQRHTTKMPRSVFSFHNFVQVTKIKLKTDFPSYISSLSGQNKTSQPAADNNLVSWLRFRGYFCKSAGLLNCMGFTYIEQIV